MYGIQLYSSTAAVSKLWVTTALGSWPWLFHFICQNKSITRQLWICVWSWCKHSVAFILYYADASTFGCGLSLKGSLGLSYKITEISLRIDRNQILVSVKIRWKCNLVRCVLTTTPPKQLFHFTWWHFIFQKMNCQNFFAFSTTWSEKGDMVYS